MNISQIIIYPIKSLKGISLDSAVVEPRGLRHDRRWMLSAPDGNFFTQREFPRMATISVEVESAELRVASEGFGEMRIPFEPDIGDRRQVKIWQSECEGLMYDGPVSEWFGDVLGTNCRLVYMPDNSRRSVNQRFDRGEDIVSFADGYPLMLLGEASLEDLNRRLSEQDTDEGVRAPLPMNRFRPNLVVTGSDAFEEDDWVRVKIGEAHFRSTKPCERCVITTIDQAAGEKTGKEPLRTLATFRTARDIMPDRIDALGVDPTAVLFGQNLIAENPGATVRVGDAVEVLDRR